MASRILGVLALVLLTVLPPAFVAQVCMTQHPPVRALPATKVALSGRTAGRVERPRAELRALDDFLKDKTSFDFAISIGTLVFTASQALQGWASYQQSLRDSERAQRDSERAQRESKEGRIEFAVDRMMQPFPPQKKEAEVVERGIIKAIRLRILRWNQHATVIAGRFGSGKSVALEEALRGMQGVYVHAVEDKDWKEALYKSLRMDDLGMLKEALRLVRKRNQGSTPILVLDIPRTTKEGMDTVSTFAKILSSDSSLAHVIVCASSAAMAIAFDAGGAERQDNFWVGDLTEDEAKELLNLHGHKDKTDEFLEACGYKALDLVHTCQRYAAVGEQALKAKNERMEKRAREEVQVFKDQCKVAGDTGKEILKELLANWQAGKGADRLCTAAFPKDVAMWIREKDCHPVIWHTVREEYQFASDRHAKVATETLNSTSQSTT
mmetsp:Transcript_22920/g.47148  ORF Transcript_22920/g.47148 Transcript_22920/m.47148 type:complete len:439 (-) Transcript_22920:18-1334(-)